MTLRLSHDHRQEILRLGERGYPHEICGLLLGRESADGERLVERIYPLENERVDSRENRYAVSGRSMFEAERYALAHGLDVIGYFHSHPNAPARPSGYDLAHATWPGISYPIVSVLDHRAVDLTSWTLADDRSAFETETIVT